MAGDLTPKPTGKMVVPGPSGQRERIEDDEDFEGLVNAEDLGSASRSCLAIIIVLVVIALLLCVFLGGTLFMD